MPYQRGAATHGGNDGDTNFQSRLALSIMSITSLHVLRHFPFINYTSVKRELAAAS